MKNVQNNSLHKIKKVILLIIVVILITSGCRTNQMGSASIDGKGLSDTGERIDELNSEVVRLSEADKYQRHYGNGLYDMDLSEPKAELKEKYQAYLASLMPYFDKALMIFDLEAEFINQSVLDYQNGTLSFEQMMAEPTNHMMSLTGHIYTFHADNPADYEKIYSEEHPYMLLGDHLNQIYRKGMLYFDVSLSQYDSRLLDKVDIETIQEQENIALFLNDYLDDCRYDFIRADNYYNLHNRVLFDSSVDIHRVERPGKSVDDRDRIAQRITVDYFKEKYGLEAYVDSVSWLALKKHPEVKWTNLPAYRDDDDTDEEFSLYLSSDYFANSYYQYLLSVRIQTILEEEGAADKIVFLVETEPFSGPEDPYYTNVIPFDLSTAEGETTFLTETYNGYVNVTFVYLKEEGEVVNEELVTRLVNELKPIMGFEAEHLKNTKICGSKYIYVYTYNLPRVAHHIVVDLFKKHALTERMPKPHTTLAEVWSLRYKTRAETPGFHYLDIFGDLVESYERVR